MWKPDRNAKIPIYRQIVEHLERRIAFGELPPGSQLPSERRMAEQLDINRSTVIQAYEELRASGLLESTVGRGTSVSRTKWGLTPSQTPNWHHYTEGGAFLPNLPLMRRIREVTRQDDQLIDLASGELSDDLFPNRLIQDLLKEQPFEEHLGYELPQGHAGLRGTLSLFLERQHGIRTTGSSILVTSGSQQSLYLITQCLLSPGDAVAIEDPSYSYSLPMFQSAGLRICRLPVHKDGIEPGDIIQLYREHRIRMIFLNPNYQNPTGSVLSMAKRKRLLEIAAEYRIPVVEDDPFSLTTMQPEPPQPLKSLDQDGIVMYIGSLSKIAASGLRIGWLVAPQSVVARLADARQQMDFGLSIVSEWLAERLMSSERFDDHIMNLQLSLQLKRDQMAESLHKHLPGEVLFDLPQGGLNLWCKINHKINDSRLLEDGIRSGVVFVPGSVYGSEEGYIRLSYARPLLKEIDPGIMALAQALRMQNAR
ncbi:aminotransferase-like domain-containing protein [Paenibacillus nasutitermitis]|uniref:GntR family transcriptional regulator n=1 Tax=Paenibacillus nasutitermitis TaxID=1652958 RepID=A0A917DU59_9BACL|nr:PLP-dependent aminotransferase family protein [Paenibacillus nasutitermitis]GGD67013.1 GntR family transcriptional regulator [Paenibacillus nasutitermitis]